MSKDFRGAESATDYLERKRGSILEPLEAMGSFVKLCGLATKQVNSSPF